MARNAQVLLSLLCVVLVNAELNLQVPFFGIPGLHHRTRPTADVSIENNKPINDHYNTESWDSRVSHYDNEFPPNRHHKHNNFQQYDPFQGGMDPFFGGFNGMGGFGQIPGGPFSMPGINNVFNIPGNGFKPHNRHPPNKDHKDIPIDHHEQKPKEDHSVDINNQNPEEKPTVNIPEDVSPINEKPIEQDNDLKLKESDKKPDDDKIDDIEELPPKTNEIKKEEVPKESKDKNKSEVDLNEKKDYLLVGADSNGNNIYLLHENNPNQNAIVAPNGNQPGNNVIYVPYNPAQANPQVYQVVNAQPSPVTTNFVSPDKLSVSNNAVTNPSPTNPNPGYVLIYSNGQLIQVPGVIVNTAQNNVQPQNRNPVQSYVIANTAPNNMQNVPAVQNPGSNVIYATLPNQGSNGPIVVQMPNCMQPSPNNVCGGAVVQNPTQGGNNVVSYQPNPNVVYQPAVLPNGASNGYGQANIVTNPGQPTITVAIPNQVYSNQNSQYQPASNIPTNTGSNAYNQPIVLNLGQQTNPPIQGGVVDNQNLPVQQVVEPVVNTGSNGYNQPMVSNRGDVPNQGDMVNNQNIPIQPAVQLPIGSGTEGYYNQPIQSNQVPIIENRGSSNDPNAVASGPINGIPSPGDQGNNAIVTSPSNDAVYQPNNEQPVFDDNDLSSLGAQPAVMLSDFKDTKDDKKDKKIKGNKDKKDKKEKGKKKEKKNKDADKPKHSKPFTNKIDK